MSVSYPRMLGNPSLAKQSMINLKSYFEHETNHRPTPEMMSALEDAALVIEDMANDECQPSFYLSSVDPGVGKTSVLIQSLYSILYSPKHRHVSILVCVSRLDEIRKITEQATLNNAMFAAFTRDPEINALGRGIDDAEKARVLFTTQQMINSRCDGKSFKDVSEFHFEGKPRGVRVWDEAYLPGESLTINRSLLIRLTSYWLTSYPALGHLTDTLSADLRGREDGDTVLIPDLEATIGATKERLLESLPTHSSDANVLSQAATTLWLLSGKKVAIRKDRGVKNGQTQTVLSYRDHLPDDLAPLLILDASGRVRKTYDLWQASDRNNLVQLRQARKTYKNLTVHLWKRGGGKSSFRNPASREELIKGICNTIDSKPDEEFLVVHHKAETWNGVEQDIEKEIRANVGKRSAPISFTSWGNHKASNQWSAIPNVILAGTLFYPISFYEALGRLSSNLSPGRAFKDEMYNETCLGEHRDGILQAGCRAAIRCSVDGDCPPSNLYIIASAQSGIPSALHDVFPKHRSKVWLPVTRKLSKKRTEALNILKVQFRRDPQSFIKFSTIRQSLGGMASRDFNKRIRKDAGFVAAIGELGIVETHSGSSVYPTGFMMAHAMYGF